jgi:hypothetical protein
MEHDDAQKNAGMTPNKWLIPCPIFNIGKPVPCTHVIPNLDYLPSMLLPLSHSLSDVA